MAQPGTAGTTGTGAGGNTYSPAPRNRKWCLTINNYTEDHLTQLAQLATTSDRYIIGREVGEQGTPHLQCFFRFKNPKRFTTLKSLIPHGHWEIAKGSIQDNFKYCSKEGHYDSNIKPKVSREDLRNMVLSSYENVVWKDWQQDVINIIDEEPDSRSIHWIYEPAGNVGKSFLCKFLACRQGTIVCSGKATDIFNQVNATIESGTVPKIVICDIPRVVSKYVSYQAIEKIKDGCLYSGKYEGGLCIFPNVHVVCFANQKPDKTAMSEDRWRVYRVQENSLFLQVGV